MKPRFITYLTALVLFGFSIQAIATPVAPTLIFSVSGLTVTAAWTSSPGATEYKLSYAPYPYTGPDSIGSVNVGGQTSFSATLWEGAAYYIAVQAGDGQSFSGYSNIKQFTTTTSIFPKKIGDVYGGGIVFYVDATGQHGLIAALSDQSEGIQWYNGVYKVTGATGDGVGKGAMNTAIIVAAQSIDDPFGSYAAKIANDYSVQEDGITPCTGAAGEICHDDWYLPSKRELNLLYQQKGVVMGNGIADNTYWSSTEFDADNVWLQLFYDGNTASSYKYGRLAVRAVRVF